MLADLAMRDGQRVAAFDLFGDLDLRRGGARVVARPGGSLTALVDAAVQMPARGVVYGASFENHPALVARLAERHALLGNGPQTLRAVRDPQRLAAALRDAGLTYPRTFAAAPDDRSGRWLRKPLRGGGGTRVRAWRGGALPAGAVVQERIDGVACSAAAVGDGVDAVVLGLTEQLVGRRAFGVRGYRWCGNVVPPRLPAGERDALLGQARAICSCLAAAFALRGLFGVDFVWDGERAWTIEVNPRPTASLEAIEAAYGVGVFGAHLRACAGELPQVESERRGRGRQGGALRHRGRGHRRQRPLAGARRARRPAPRRAHRRGASDLHARGRRRDAAGRAERARGAGRAAARGARAARGGGGGWLTRRAPGAGAPATTSRRPSPAGG